MSMMRTVCLCCMCRVLVYGGSGGRASHILELRTWRLQPVGLLSSERQHMVSSACPQMNSACNDVESLVGT
jgi:hypothetical protein